MKIHYIKSIYNNLVLIVYAYVNTVNSYVI